VGRVHPRLALRVSVAISARNYPGRDAHPSERSKTVLLIIPASSYYSLSWLLPSPRPEAPGLVGPPAPPVHGGVALNTAPSQPRKRQFCDVRL